MLRMLVDIMVITGLEGRFRAPSLVVAPRDWAVQQFREDDTSLDVGPQTCFAKVDLYLEALRE